MATTKWFILCAAACLAAMAGAAPRRGPTKEIETKRYGDLLVTPVPFDSGYSHSDGSRGYYTLYYDVVNTSQTASHAVAFRYAQHYRTPPVVLPPGGTKRFSLVKMAAYGNLYRGANLEINGRIHPEEAPIFYGDGSRWSTSILLSPGLSKTAVEYRVEVLFKEQAKISEETELYKSLDSLKRPTNFFDTRMPLAEWPEDWRAYSGYSALVMVEEDYLALPPNVSAAIGRYVAAGGYLLRVGREGEPEALGLGRVVFHANATVEEWSAEDCTVLLRNESRRSSNLWAVGTGAWQTVIPPVSGTTMLAAYLALLFITVNMGPLLMWRLARKNQRVKIYVIAPLAGAAVCVAVVITAYCMDGVTPVVRANASVLIDAKNNTAVTLSRVIIKAPTAVRGGMVFGRDTVVEPLLEKGGGRRVVWAEEALQFNTAWLPSRNPSGFFLRNVGTAPEKTLEIIAETEEGLTVQNHFAEPLTWLFARGADETHYFAEAVPPGATALLTSRSTNEFARLVQRETKEEDLTINQRRRLNESRFALLSLYYVVAHAADPANLQHSPIRPLPEPHFFVAAMPGTPFTETFIFVNTEARGETTVFGTFTREDSP